MSDEAPHPEREIDIQDLKVAFGDFYALKGVSFYANKKEFLGIIGASGAGKTTVLRVLTGQISHHHAMYHD